MLGRSTPTLLSIIGYQKAEDTPFVEGLKSRKIELLKYSSCRATQGMRDAGGKNNAPTVALR